ncbi:MAG: hypothetical protein RLZZ519_1953 [Bacteroidota bacterium]|jgi:hypothetical protein
MKVQKRNMKKTKITLLFWAALLMVAIGFAGCATSTVGISVLVPADIKVDQSIKTIALVNRYRPDKGEGFLNVVEGALSGENIGQDRRSAEEALMGLTNALAASPRFSITRPGIELKGTGGVDFPVILAEVEVQEICKKAGAQALVTIEAFDSDQQVACTTQVRERKNKAGETEKYTVWMARKTIQVMVGWRMYDGQYGHLIDQMRMQESVYFNAEGNSEGNAIANLPQGESVTREIGRVTGASYSRHISPTWLPVSRSYYTKGSDYFKAGKKRVKINDWAGAKQMWERATDDEKTKVKGRALYNLALAAEMDGDLEGASELAKDAYRKYDIRKAMTYRNILEQRIRDQERLNEQMEGAEK